MSPYFRITMAVMFVGLLFVSCIAQAQQKATASLTISITVLPHFRVVSERLMGDGTKELTVESNMREVVLDGVTYPLGRPGTHLLRVPASAPLVQARP